MSNHLMYLTFAVDTGIEYSANIPITNEPVPETLCAGAGQSAVAARSTSDITSLAHALGRAHGV